MFELSPKTTRILTLLLCTSWFGFLIGTMILGFSPSCRWVLIPIILFSLISIYFTLCRNNLTIWEIAFSRRALVFVFAVQTTAWLIWTIQGYYSFEFNTFDTGIFAQLSYHFWKTGHYFSSVLRMHGFADHFTPILAILSPLYAIFPSFLLFPILKVFAFGVAASFLYRSSEYILGKDHPWICIAPVLFLLNKYVSAIMMMEFQPSTIAIPFLLGALHYGAQEKYKKMYVFLFLLLLFKEHLGFCWATVGIYLFFFKKQRARGVVIGALGILITLFIFKGFMPWIAGRIIHHEARISLFAFPQEKLSAIFKATRSVVFLPLFSPLAFLATIPSFVLTICGGIPEMVSLHFHYHDVAITALHFMAIYGLKSIWDCQKKFEQGQMFIQAAFALFFFSFFFGDFSNQVSKKIYKARPSVEELDLVEQINAIKEPLEEPTVELYVQDYLGPYFFKSDNLHSIISLNFLKRLPPSGYIVLSPIAPPFPLSNEELNILWQSLDSSPNVKRQPSSQHLGVWTIRSNN